MSAIPDRLRIEFRRLPQVERSIIERRFGLGEHGDRRTTTEIAKSDEIPVPVVNQLLGRAASRLRRQGVADIVRQVLSVGVSEDRHRRALQDLLVYLDTGPLKTSSQSSRQRPLHVSPETRELLDRLAANAVVSVDGVILESSRVQDAAKELLAALAPVGDGRAGDGTESERRTSASAYKSWTEQNDLELRRMFGYGKSGDEICSALGRSPGAITSRLKKLGLI